MKNLLCLFLFLIPSFGFGQFYSSYSNQQAYNYGRAMTLYMQGKESICNGYLNAVMDMFEEATKLGYADAREGLALIYELGLGCSRSTSNAQYYYELGAKMESQACKSAILRINNQGWMTSEHKEAWLRNFRTTNSSQYESGVYIPYNSGGVNNNVDHSCRACNNTGVCGGCYGLGISYGTTCCNMCHGSGKCMNCGGKG